jgi:hypothetical protein
MRTWPGRPGAITLFVEELDAAKPSFGEVEDVNAMCAELVTGSVELLNGPMDRPRGLRTAGVRDSGDHLREIAQ